MRIRALATAGTLALAIAGCGSSEPPPETPTASASAASNAPTAAAPSSSAAPSGPAVGLAAKDNDPTVVTLARAALACPWEPGGFAYSCEGYKAWSANHDAFKGAERTLINMLEDPDEKVRWLAALELGGVVSMANSSLGAPLTHPTDKVLAARVVAAAEKETVPLLGPLLGARVGDIDFDKTGLWDRAQAMIHKHVLPELGKEIVVTMVRANPENDAVMNAAMEESRSPDDHTAIGGIAAFKNISGSKAAEKCKFLLDNIENNPHEWVAGSAVEVIAGNKACTGQLDAVVTAIGKRVKDPKKLENDAFPTALTLFCEGVARPTDKQKASAAALAKAIVASSATGKSVRVTALQGLDACDPKAAKAEAKKYVSDKDEELSRKAKELVKAP